MAGTEAASSASARDERPANIQGRVRHTTTTARCGAKKYVT